MGLRKHTQIVRRSVSMTGRTVYDLDGTVAGSTHVIVGPEQDAPSPSAIRRITVSVPESPTVYLALGPQITLGDGTDLAGVDDAGATPEDIANSRDYQWPTPDAGRDFVFEILPDQWLAAKSSDGVADLTVVIEYLS